MKFIIFTTFGYIGSGHIIAALNEHNNLPPCLRRVPIANDGAGAVGIPGEDCTDAVTILVVEEKSGGNYTNQDKQQSVGLLRPFFAKIDKRCCVALHANSETFHEAQLAILTSAGAYDVKQLKYHHEVADDPYCSYVDAIRAAGTGRYAMKLKALEALYQNKPIGELNAISDEREARIDTQELLIQHLKGLKHNLQTPLATVLQIKRGLRGDAAAHEYRAAREMNEMQFTGRLEQIEKICINAAAMPEDGTYQALDCIRRQIESVIQLRKSLVELGETQEDQIREYIDRMHDTLLSIKRGLEELMSETRCRMQGQTNG